MIGSTISHYRITGKLGSGGMGDVYEAEDTELRRKVALKVLPEDLASDPERLERFKREARAVAALNHPNIVTLHSVEEADGSHFLTMELVEGQSLEQLIPEAGFDLDRLFELAIPVADALSAAHEKGVVHRDLKPANVMLGSDGRVKIVDFGLAKLWEAEPGHEETALETEGLTKEGVAMGTAPYMSPEQLQGIEVDHRSDLFSLGILIFEMTTGRRPFRGNSSIELASSILKDSPDSVTDIREGVPRHLGRIIRHCLEKDPELRYQSAKDVRNELAGLKEEVKSGEVPLSTGAMPAIPAPQSAAQPALAASPSKPGWLIPGAVVALLAVVALMFWMMQGRDDGTSQVPQDTAESAADETGLKKIVVLPFDNLGAAEDEYFAAGMTEEISSRLASTSNLGVISRSSAIQYDRSGKTIKQVGEDLGVGYVLEGTVRWAKSGDGTSRVRITPQLTRVADDTQLWAESYDRTIEDIFEVQSEVADAVLQSLDLQLLAGSGQADGGRPTENLEAYNLFLQAKNIAEQVTLSQKEEDRYEAVELLEQALELDPDFAQAWAELSEQHAELYFNGEDRTEERLEKSLSAVERALAIDPEMPQAYVALGHYYYWGPRDYARALEAFDKAAASLPNDPDLMASIAYIRRRQGHFEEALEKLKRSVDLDPRSVQKNRALGTTYVSLGRYEEADQQMIKTLELSSQAVGARLWRALNWLLWKGDARGAAKMADPLIASGVPDFLHFKAAMLTTAGDFQEALDLLGALEEKSYPNQFFANSVDLQRAWVLRHMGRLEESQSFAATAVEYLEAEVLANPNDPRMHGSLGQAYALVGRAEEAVREGERAVKLQPVSMDAMEGPGRLFELSKIHSALENETETLELLDRLLDGDKAWVSVPSIQIDPTYGFLRDDAGYRELIKKHS